MSEQVERWKRWGENIRDVQGKNARVTWQVWGGGVTCQEYGIDKVGIRKKHSRKIRVKRWCIGCGRKGDRLGVEYQWLASC
jgi:hypothetical protein